MVPQIWLFNAATGKALTIVFAGLAFTTTSLPKIFFFPALVAGFTRVLIRQRPGMVKMPFLFTSVVATLTRLLMIPATCFAFISCSAARAAVNAPLVIAFASAFIDFIAFIGAMIETYGLISPM